MPLDVRSYGGTMTVGELLQYGDLGIGTLDLQMTGVDSSKWQGLSSQRIWRGARSSWGGSVGAVPYAAVVLTEQR